ncbi:TPA: beta-ketoacyl synthase N-terminal-like domain-containing protein, partial [Escherichia coli]
AFSSCCSSVSTLLGLQGGVELVATACTASPNAVGMAFDYIQNGKSKTMLAVGTEPIYLPTFAGFYALNVMHPDTCTPFSGQSGMSIGEGAGAIVLEEYEHAVARGATIYGEILSYATSCDAFHETGPDPRASGAVQVMNKAMANAGVTPEQIDYVNAHGTGTEANDRIETLAMKKVFANHDKL